MEAFNELLSTVDGWLGWVLLFALLPLGLYFTVRTGVVQLRLLPEMFRVIKEPAGHDADGNKNISPFRAFSISAASRVGTANIAGVALAISVGGPGALFWMWVTAIVGGATAFVESTLGQLYKVKDGAAFRGGPAYYIARGLKSPWLGSVFAVIVIVTYGIVFNTVQSNSIVDSLSTSFNMIPPASASRQSSASSSVSPAWRSSSAVCSGFPTSPRSSCRSWRSCICSSASSW